MRFLLKRPLPDQYVRSQHLLAARRRSGKRGERHRDAFSLWCAIPPISIRNKMGRIVFLQILILSEQGATRFFGAKMTASFVILVAGRRPGGLVCLAGRDFYSRKTPKDLPARKMKVGKEADEGGRAPTEDDDAASRRIARCSLRVSSSNRICRWTFPHTAKLMFPFCGCHGVSP